MQLNKFNKGDIIKRIGSTDITGEGIEALNLIGTIIDITESGEYPPNSGKILPQMYIIDFPELYKDSYNKIKVMIGVIEEDLELVQKHKIVNKYYELNDATYQKFFECSKFINIFTNKKGIVKRLRNDDCEKQYRKNDPTHYYYSVDYDDGTFQSYESQKYMKCY